jgi:chromosome segregation ATPase
MEIEWLDALETRVHEAAERLRDLKEKNADLERRNAELEARPAAAGPDPGDWQSERDGIRRRVEKLAETLGELLEE